MRAVPIEDSEVWEGAHHRIISPPDGDLENPDVSPVDAVIDTSEGFPIYFMKVALEGDDLEKLQNGGDIWVGMWGCVVPWNIQVIGGES